MAYKEKEKSFLLCFIVIYTEPQNLCRLFSVTLLEVPEARMRNYREPLRFVNPKQKIMLASE